MSAATQLRLRPFLAGLEPYVPGEQPSGADIVKLNTNENPYPPSATVVAAVAEAAAGLGRYPHPTSDPLRRALADYHGVGVESVLAGNGSDEILRLLVQAFVGLGGKIAVVDPTYSLYPVLAATFEGGTAVYALVDREVLPPELFDAPEPLLLLPNPNPPIGTLYAHDEIARLCVARPERLVVLDEAYVDFAPRDAVALLADHPNLAITRTFSKSFSLAGMRIGYLLGDPALVAELMKIKDSYNLSQLAQAAGVAAIAAADEMRVKAESIVETRAETRAALERLGYRVPESHGNFLFAIHPEAQAHFLELRRHGVLVRYFDVHGLRDGMRITIGTADQMARFLVALEEIVG